MNLNELDDDEFADEMDENLGLENDWKQFTDDSVIRRTGEALEELELKLQMQIRSHTGSGDGDWERRVGNKLSLVQFRLRQARRQIHALDSGEARNERAWKLFAHELCEALEDSDLEPALDDIPTPFEGLTARQWLRRRQEKRGVVAGMSVFDAVMLTAILIYAFMFAITFVLELTAGGESVRVAALSALVFLGVMTALGGVIALLAFAITSMWSGVSA